MHPVRGNLQLAWGKVLGRGKSPAQGQLLLACGQVPADGKLPCSGTPVWLVADKSSGGEISPSRNFSLYEDLVHKQLS